MYVYVCERSGKRLFKPPGQSIWPNFVPAEIEVSGQRKSERAVVAKRIGSPFIIIRRGVLFRQHLQFVVLQHKTFSLGAHGDDDVDDDDDDGHGDDDGETKTIKSD